jgi:hypothetical protein
MFGLQYVAMYQNVRLVRRGARIVYPVIIFGKVSMSELYVSGEVSLCPVTSSTMLRHTNQNNKFMEFTVVVPVAQ